MSFNALRKNKILAKISKSTVYETSLPKLFHLLVFFGDFHHRTVIMSGLQIFFKIDGPN